MKKREYIFAIIAGVVFLGLAYFFRAQIAVALTKNNFSDELFNFSATMFGLILTAYAIIFGLIPALRKDIAESDTIKEVNAYFKFSLFALILQIIVALIYSLTLNMTFFILNMGLLGLNLYIFFEIILTVNDLFKIIIKERN